MTRFSIYMFVNDDTKLGVTHDNQLMVSDEKETKFVSLGCTKQSDVDALKYYLDRMAIHLPNH